MILSHKGTGMATDGEGYLGLQTTILKKYWVKRFQDVQSMT